MRFYLVVAFWAWSATFTVPTPTLKRVAPNRNSIGSVLKCSPHMSCSTSGIQSDDPRDFRRRRAAAPCCLAEDE